eukprot:CAMPEP_0194316186 /NCGR_PEP_ID=MMETSP0171-20130528/13005_1 /TAXON_ID=218684 /ORGANISM="Corethron pennatum, Strain L29A3" /LENGTH=54 /DNA_ID=CAMNT_0039072341 /DNA_START=121 /DNA_END=285 /DNA_ORIENTATION=+
MSFLGVSDLLGSSPFSFILTEADSMTLIASFGIFASPDESSAILESIKTGVSSI